MEFLNKGAPPKGGRYYRCSRAARHATCANSRLWKWELVEKALLPHLGGKRLRDVFEPKPDNSPSPVQQYEAQIAGLVRMRDRAIKLYEENTVDGDDDQLRTRVAELRRRIVTLEAKRNAAAEAERRRPDPEAARATLKLFSDYLDRLASAEPAERIRLRRMITQQIRNVFSEVRFSDGAIHIVMEIPHHPSTDPGINPFFGSSSEIRIIDEVERYFLLHTIYDDDPKFFELCHGRKPTAGEGTFMFFPFTSRPRP